MLLELLKPQKPKAKDKEAARAWQEEPFPLQKGVLQEWQQVWGKRVGKIFAFGHKEIHKVELDALASKVLHDIHLRPGDTAKEEEIMLLAKHKVWKMLKNKHD